MFRFTENVRNAANASLLFMLLDMLHSRIQWEAKDPAATKAYKVETKAKAYKARPLQRPTRLCGIVPDPES